MSKKTIRNESHKGDWLTPRSIMKFSNNIGTARIGLDLGAARVSQALVDLGFGKKTGIEFPGEPSGLMSHFSKWKQLELANISFGHGVGVTALQLTTGVSAIANGGFTVRPKLISQWLHPQQAKASGLQIQVANRRPSVRVFSQNTVDQITDFMEAVLEPEGTGKRAKIPGYRVAGKTGTAQMIDPQTGRYSRSVFTSSFVGFLPASNPKLVGMMVFRAPKGGLHGGQIAAPVFQKVMANTVRYLGIKPDDTEIPESELEPKLTQAGIGVIAKTKKRRGQTI